MQHDLVCRLRLYSVSASRRRRGNRSMDQPKLLSHSTGRKQFWAERLSSFFYPYAGTALQRQDHRPDRCLGAAAQRPGGGVSVTRQVGATGRQQAATAKRRQAAGRNAAEGSAGAEGRGCIDGAHSCQQRQSSFSHRCARDPQLPTLATTFQSCKMCWVKAIAGRPGTIHWLPEINKSLTTHAAGHRQIHLAH